MITGISTPYTPQWSLDGITFFPCLAYDYQGNPVTSISTAQLYRLPGSVYLRLFGGTGATVLIRAGS